MMGVRAARRLALVVAVASLLVASCSDDGEDSAEPADTTASSTASSPTTSGGDGSTTAAPATTAATSDPGPGTTAPTSGSPDRCPLTAEQVSEVIGVTMEDVGGCVFFPPEKSDPSALFVRQVSFACNDDIRQQNGYEEAFDGLGVEAYVKRGTSYGVQILVCEEQPFEVAANLTDDDAASQTAAEALARLALASG